jgi:hypothetical protein
MPGMEIWMLVWKTGAYEERRDEEICLKFIFNFSDSWGCGGFGME